MSDRRPLFVILGNQLFAPEHLAAWTNARFFMAEDLGLCTDVRHHQQKIVLFLAAMRHHGDALAERGWDVAYTELTDPLGDAAYEDKLDAELAAHPTDELVSFEIEDAPFAARIDAWAEAKGLRRTIVPSPMFLTPRAEFEAYLDGARRKPFMARFYERQRTRLNILVDEHGAPEGGQWSFDHDNRRKIPRDVAIPELPAPAPTDHVRAVQAIVAERFADHPGSAADFWLPVTRRSALAWLRRFIEERLELFGHYEDAMTTRDPFLFHSVLTPMLNLGLVTPAECIERALAHAEAHDTPINSLEGFVRQIIGWREFVRGVYHAFGEEQASRNFFGHERRLTDAWFDGSTGLDPLDHTIETASRWGWTHHIERLMIAGNLMVLCRVHPPEAYRWFMEMYIDSSDWVMGPNVYGMGIFSDGGIFSTKPYICGSNYIRKMSDFPKGDWCEVMDGLYWKFIADNRAYFQGNHRLSMMPRQLDKMADDRRDRIFGLAEGFIERVTTPG
ncbi:MAG: cryptochrome/photolyase family protein [Phycisphaerales bacterium]